MHVPYSLSFKNNNQKEVQKEKREHIHTQEKARKKRNVQHIRERQRREMYNTSVRGKKEKRRVKKTYHTEHKTNL
jgi:hypothetical protein